MLPLVPGFLLLAALPFALALSRARPWLLRSVALASCALPFLLPASAPVWRSFAAIYTCGMLVRMLQYAAGHVRPRSTIDFLMFTVALVNIRWETPRRPNPHRAALAFATSLFQFGLAWLLMLVVARLDVHNPVQLFTIQLGLYLVVAALCNLSVVKFSLLGLDYDDGFNHPLGSISPGEFWSRRWNTSISQLLHRYVFLPVGGRRHPLRGMFAAFAVSGVVHELVFDIGARKFNGGMLAYFFLQAGLVAVTSRSRFFRRLVRDLPGLAWLLTLILMLGTGILFVQGLDGVDPSNAWRRVFGPT